MKTILTLTTLALATLAPVTSFAQSTTSLFTTVPQDRATTAPDCIPTGSSTGRGNNCVPIQFVLPSGG